MIQKRYMRVLWLTLWLGSAAVAQSFPKYEVSAGYSYMYFHPELPQLTSQSLNGGGGSFVYNATHWLGLEAQVSGYSFGQGWIDTLRQLGYLGSANANMFLFQFGPQLKKHSGRWQPYVASLYGFAHSKGYGAALRAKGSGTYILSTNGATTNAFAMQLGGGLDIRLTRRVQLRAAEIDYQLTRFGFQTFSSNQNNFKVFTGINFTLGKK